jgi:hypothetical protein
VRVSFFATLPTCFQDDGRHVVNRGAL